MCDRKLQLSKGLVNLPCQGESRDMGVLHAAELFSYLLSIMFLIAVFSD